MEVRFDWENGLQGKGLWTPPYTTALIRFRALYGSIKQELEGETPLVSCITTGLEKLPRISEHLQITLKTNDPEVVSFSVSQIHVSLTGDAEYFVSLEICPFPVTGKMN